MPRIVLTPPLDTEFFGGSEELQVQAASIFELVRMLDELGPGFGDDPEVRFAFAVDGVITGDWSVRLAKSCEVIVLPRIGGG